MKKFFAFIPALAVLAACGAPAPQVSTGPVKPLPTSVFDEAFASVVADSIADECRSLKYNRAHENMMTDLIGEELVVRGYTERDVDHGFANMDEAKLQSDYFSYIEDNNIIVNDRQSWCRAGVAEIGADSRIGRYLAMR